MVVLKPNDEMKKRALLALLDCPGMPAVDLLHIMTLSGDLKRADRVLADAVETGEIVRDEAGRCELGDSGLELAGLHRIIEQNLHNFDDEEEENEHE